MTAATAQLTKASYRAKIQICHKKGFKNLTKLYVKLAIIIHIKMTGKSPRSNGTIYSK